MSNENIDGNTFIYHVGVVSKNEVFLKKFPLCHNTKNPIYNILVTQKEEKAKRIPFSNSFYRDVSGFVPLFYILSKNKIFRIFGRHILDFWPIISCFS